MTAVVTPAGTLLSCDGRNKASSLSKHTEGVQRVVNRLTIGQKKG